MTGINTMYAIRNWMTQETLEHHDLKHLYHIFLSIYRDCIRENQPCDMTLHDRNGKVLETLQWGI